MKKLSAIALLLAASLALVACGGGSSSTTGTSESTSSEAGGTSGSTIHFEANPEGHLMFTTMKETGKAGDDTIDFTNPSTTPHNLAIENSAGEKIEETKTITKSETSKMVEFEPGTYTFFCSIPGHREGGMEGTLTIE